MTSRAANPLAKKWQYDISRNVPLWHDSLYFVNGGEYKKYGLSPPFHFRVHRGGLTDFYLLARGRYSHASLVKKLAANLRRPGYIVFLKNAYRRDCAALIIKSKIAAKDKKYLRRFFAFYGRAECMLDITAQASKILTAEAVGLLKNFPLKDEILAYYSQPKKLSPLQKMEKALSRLPADADTTKEAAKLWRQFRWMPVSFVGEPWNRDFFARKIKIAFRQLSFQRKLESYGC